MRVPIRPNWSRLLPEGIALSDTKCRISGRGINSRGRRQDGKRYGLTAVDEI